MDDVRMAVGHRISLLRNKLGYTQEQLCEYADISQNYLSLLENGRKNCSIDTLAKIAEALKTNPSYFLSAGKPDAAVRPDNYELQINALVCRLSKSEKKLTLMTLRNLLKLRKNSR